MNKEEINKRIMDRSDCFYWQTDRKISAEEAAFIWKDRHFPITNEELLEKINKELKDNKLIYIKPFSENDETSFGNVNSIRVGVLEDGTEVIIRCHPKGIKNGYFYVESLASKLALENNIPTYKTILIHELQNADDIAFQVIQKLDGHTVQYTLRENPEKEEKLVYEMGVMMARIHKISLSGFGPMNNEKAKNGNLVGIHKTLSEAVNAGLDENLERLVTYDILTEDVAKKMKALFIDNPLLDVNSSVLIHNDFVDWNLLTDGDKITGIIDWDECVAGHPIQEIACWSTFFDPERITSFLEGYFSETSNYENFDELFNLFRLRYTISKMALRIKRYTYEQTPFLKSMLDKGKTHLEDLIKIFDL